MKRRMFWALAWFAGILASACSGAAAGEARDVEGFTKHEYYRVQYDVRGDGTHVETREWALKVLRKPGVDQANTTSISYSDRLQDAVVLLAYTRKADGRRLDVPAKNFQLVTRSGKGEAEPMFSDLKSQTVTFPDVEVGDTVVFSYRLTQKEALFPGQFSLIERLPMFSVMDEATVTLTAPEALTLHVFARGVEGGTEERLEGRRRWHWVYRNPRAKRPEPSSVSPVDYGPLILASTFTDYHAIGAAYDARAKLKTRVTDRIRALADEVTQHATSAREQAKALYEWVGRNIGYAGNCVGVGSVVPHDAADVLANRLGDCKDHVVLLEALLAVKGIASTPALVHSGRSYRLPAIPVVFAFNHVITYLPDLDLFLDPSAEDVPFGRLPHELEGKTVVLTRAPGGLRQVPRSDPKTNHVETKTTVRIQSDGSASGETRIDVRGLFAVGVKGWMDYVQPREEDELIQRMLSRSGFTGIGTLQRADTSRVAERYEYGSRYELRDVLSIPGPGALIIRSPMNGPASIASFTGTINMPAPTVDFVCTGGTSVEEFVYQFPDGVEILAAPKDMRFETRLATYTAQYRRDGNVLTVRRAIEDRTPGPVCPPDDAAVFKAMAEAIVKDLRSQVLYR